MKTNDGMNSQEKEARLPEVVFTVVGGGCPAHSLQQLYGTKYSVLQEDF